MPICPLWDLPDPLWILHLFICSCQGHLILLNLTIQTILYAVQVMVLWVTHNFAILVFKTFKSEI
jgi:hypothetical protein